MKLPTLPKELGRARFEQEHRDKDLSRYTDIEALLAGAQPGDYKDPAVQLKWDKLPYIRMTDKHIAFVDANGVERVKIGKLT